MLTFVLRGGRIFDGEDFSYGDIRVEEGKIAAIGRCFCDDAAVFDASGCIVSAGLVDIHTHFSVTGTEEFGFPPDLATIPFGVTAAADAAAVTADRPYLDRLSVRNAVFVPLHFTDGRPDFAATAATVAAFGDRAAGVKLYFDTGMFAGIGPEHLAAFAAFARERGLILMVHSAHSPVPMTEIVARMHAGDILTHAYHGGRYTMADNDFAAYAAAREKGILIDTGMAGGVHTDFSVLRQAIARGCIPDTVSSDSTCLSAYVRGGLYGLPMCMRIMRIAGMCERDIFRAVTKNAARAVRREREWFGMRVGDKACLSVLREEPCAIDITDGAGGRITDGLSYVCKMTVLDGRILYRSGCRQIPINF